MWSESQTLRLIAFSCLIGFVVFCASYSYMVWRRRNKSAGNAGANRFRSWFVTSAVLGLLSMAVAFAVREAVSSEGNVATENFLVARAGDDTRVIDVHKEGPVAAGEVLVRFQSPKIESELSQAKVRLQKEEAEPASLALQPFQLDPELVRRHHNAVADKRTLQDSLDNVLTAHEAAERDLQQSVFLRQEALSKLEGELVVTDGELKQAETKYVISKNQLERDLSVRAGIIPLNEINERQKEVTTLATEVVKLKGRKSNLEGQRKQMQEMIDSFKTLSTKQTLALKTEQERIKRDLTKAEENVAEYTSRLKDDETRAAKLRVKDREQMERKIDETRAAVVGLQQQLEVRATQAGRVFYAHTSGAAAAPGTPVVVVGPEDGFRFRVRMSATQAAALQSASDVTLDVGDSQLARKFPAKFRQTIELPNEPGSVIAEMEASPTAEAVKVMAEETKMKARLTWRFPLLTFWPFRIGLMLFAVGVGGLLLTSAMGRATLVPSSSTPSNPSLKLPGKAEPPVPMKVTSNDILVPIPIQEAETIEPMYPEAIPVLDSTETVVASDVRDLVRKDPIIVHSAESGALLELLAIRLRESINREQLESDLVESAEWAVEHHGQRALRVFRQVFRQDNHYVPHMEVLLERLESPHDDETPTIVQQRELTRRTVRILEQIGHRFLNPVAIA